MTELDNIILDLCKREEEAGCYDYEIAGIKVYNLVRFDVRNFYLQAKGYNFIEKYKGADYIEIVRTIIKSTFKLSKTWFGKRKFETKRIDNKCVIMYIEVTLCVILQLIIMIVLP